MSFPAGCSDHDFMFLMNLFRGRSAAQPFREDIERLIKSGWLQRSTAGQLEVTAIVAEHFRATWKPIIVSSASRQEKKRLKLAATPSIIIRSAP